MQQNLFCYDMKRNAHIQSRFVCCAHNVIMCYFKSVPKGGHKEYRIFKATCLLYREYRKCSEKLRYLQGEHKDFPRLQTLITRKLRGIQTYFLPLLKLLTPNVNYSGRTAPLTSKVAFYIFIQQI